MVERFQVQSRSPFEIHHILTGLEKTPETIVESELFLPEGEGPFGCVIALHGSIGWASHHQDHINGWLDAGLAVCKVNSFTSRSINSTVDDQFTLIVDPILKSQKDLAKIVGSTLKQKAEKVTDSEIQ